MTQKQLDYRNLEFYLRHHLLCWVKRKVTHETNARGEGRIIGLIVTRFGVTEAQQVKKLKEELKQFDYLHIYSGEENSNEVHIEMTESGNKIN